MRYFIELSDNRSKCLEKLLQKDGFDTAPFSFDNIIAGKEDAIVFSPAKKLTVEEINKLPNKCQLFAGAQSADVIRVIMQKDIDYMDYMQSPEYVVKNANLTAEGVLALLIENTDRSIFDMNILLLGGGRVGKSIAVLFNKLGVKFSICEYDETKIGDLYHLTENVIKGAAFALNINDFNVIINSIPSPIITREIGEKIPDTTLLIDTASISCLAYNEVSFRYLNAPRLPQRYTPLNAALLLYDYIKKSRNET
jgi:dipicolinate synthase subunit A